MLAAATALLGLTACNKPAEETVPPPAAAPAPAAKPAPETKPAAEAKPQATAPAAAAPAAKSGVLTRDEAMALAAKGNCVACHKIETRLVGPAWQDVGAKYKGDPNAVATIASHIKSGGSFGWKFGVMPPRGSSQISDADVESLAKFIASLK
jgi:cytochrome c551/c552